MGIEPVSAAPRGKESVLVGSGWEGEIVGGSDVEGFSTGWFIPSRRLKSASDRASSVWWAGKISVKALKVKECG